MWMNMGFWKDTEDFPTACRTLLEEVLKSALVLHDQVSSKNIVNTLSIIDLGFGCGDQSLYFKNVLDNQRRGKRDDQWRKNLKGYVGLTLESAHFSIAQERLGLNHQNINTGFDIYCADAGRPTSWTSEIKNSVSLASQANGEKGDHENWLLGLDTLYHFQPSRWPVIEYANRELGASLMAYDLCIAENLSLRQRIVLRLMAFFGQSPFANWLTIEEYRERLVMAGYARERIEIRDISEHVFSPLAGFLRKREVELQQYGLSIGRFRISPSIALQISTPLLARPGKKNNNYDPRDPRRGALAILKQAKVATASDTALRLNVVAIADHPAAAGTTNVSAIPKQYSNGSFEADDRAKVRNESIDGVCKYPRFAGGSENEQIVVENNCLPSSAVPLLDDPNEECNASDLAAHSPKGAVCRSPHHHANVAIHREIDIGRKGR
ncbi:hypothetical protein V500_05785 [Pseudogymnoascus sp. VKM F-4518 (FW-2643)]|nr:hypothetical protein V500_05785 [Pseudogymnoascus sp. VKM F-4518 (FW-2643)]